MILISKCELATDGEDAKRTLKIWTYVQVKPNIEGLITRLRRHKGLPTLLCVDENTQDLESSIFGT